MDLSRRVLAAAIPAVAVFVWAATVTADQATTQGFLLLLLTLPFVILTWGLTRGRAVLRGSVWRHAPALVAGAMATSAWLLRMWSKHYPEETGIVPFFIALVGFWWPALAVCMAALVLERWLARGAVPHFGVRVGVGLLSGGAGLVLFFFLGATYFQRVDRYALDEDVNYWLARRVSEPMRYRHAGGVLTVDVSAGARARQPAYEVAQWSESLRGGALDLTRRKDVDRVVVVARAAGAELFRIEVTDADRAAPGPSPPGVRPPGRTLDGASLERMARPLLSGADPFGEWARRFRAEAAGDEVRITFEPPGPPGRDTAEWYSAGWESANEIVSQVTRYFPEIARFRADMPGLKTVVERGAAPGRLQSPLLPPERVLGVLVREGGRGKERLDPAKFYTELGPGFQVAVVRETPPLWSHGTGWLYEGIRLTPGMLYVLEIAPDATATFVYQSNDGELSGPYVLRPGSRIDVAGEAIHNLGWFERSAFVPRP